MHSLWQTPPCIDMIIKKLKVFYAFEDPDTRTYKKAKKFFLKKE